MLYESKCLMDNWHTCVNPKTFQAKPEWSGIHYKNETVGMSSKESEKNCEDLLSPVPHDLVWTYKCTKIKSMHQEERFNVILVMSDKRKGIIVSCIK